MTTELDRIAKKQAKQRIDKAQKKLSIKRHNIKAAQKAHSADPNREEGLFGYGLKSTEKSKSLHKKLRKNEKTDAWMDKISAKVDKGKSLITDLEKKDIVKKGFPSKAKFAGGGIALRGLGRAFMKGGKV
jgi:uncharacterized protein YaaN involved in tellurite resistance